ncbi:hypothetical protein [Undibacterium sp. Ji22W]|uniref:hypothetical protein n=1 Tax=Undibacterium sp. Ji22W TaxID=3413038 RepID=UPI003BF33B11
MKSPLTPEIYKAINESQRYIDLPERTLANKVLALLGLCAPTCQGLLAYKTTQNGVRSIELQAAISMDIDPTDPPDPLVYTCACNQIKNRTCPGFQLVRDRLAEAARRYDLYMLTSEPQIETNMIDCDSEARTIDDTNGDVIISDFLNLPHWCNQQLYPIVVYRTPCIDNAKHSTNSSKSQSYGLEYCDVLHFEPLIGDQAGKDITP